MVTVWPTVKIPGLAKTTLATLVAKDVPTTGAESNHRKAFN
jgi:hypothetical protein